MLFTRPLILVIFILLISSVLRFYNLPNVFVFAGDEEYQAILAQTIVKHFHLIWIGVGAAHTGFYLGPYWTYFTAFWLWLSKGDPLVTGYISSFIGVLTTLLTIITGWQLFGKRVGLISGLLYATLPLIVFFDQKYWNPTLIPFLSLLILLALSKMKKNQNWAILLSGCLGLIFHTHLSLFPLIFVAGFWLIKQKIKLSKRVIFLSIAAFLLIIAPLIAFDYFHKGSNILTFLRFNQISSDPVNKINPRHHFQAFFQTLGRIWYIAPFGNNSDEIITSCTSTSRIGSSLLTDQISRRFNPPPLLSLFGLAIFVLFLLSKYTWQKQNYSLLALFILSITGFFLFFPGGAFEYYLLGIFPLLLFLPAILIEYYKQLKLVIISIAILASILGIFTVISNNPEFGLGVKKPLIQQSIKLINNQPFDIKQTGICHFYEGWRYLFILNGKKPQRSQSDEGLGWLYSSEITDQKTRYTIILSETRAPINFEVKGSTILRSEGFSAYIFTNFN